GRRRRRCTSTRVGTWRSPASSARPASTSSGVTCSRRRSIPLMASETGRRVALVANTGGYVGPPLALALAERGHDLVIGAPTDELLAQLDATDAAVEVVEGVADLNQPESAPALAEAALRRFGRIDSAVAFSGIIVTGRFLRSTIEDLQTVERS